MDEELLSGVGFCYAGAMNQHWRLEAQRLEKELHQANILLRREIRKNETLRNKLKKIKQ